MQNRNTIIFKSNVVPYCHGIANFQTLSYKDFLNLVKKGLLKKTQKVGNSPTTQQYIDFCQKLLLEQPKIESQINFHGFVTDESRGNICIIEGMSIERGLVEIKDDLMKKLKFNFRFADTINAQNGEFWCWFDD